MWKLIGTYGSEYFYRHTTYLEWELHHVNDADVRFLLCDCLGGTRIAINEPKNAAMGVANEYIRVVRSN